MGPEDWIKNIETGEVEWSNQAINEETTPVGYEYLGTSFDYTAHDGTDRPVKLRDNGVYFVFPKQELVDVQPEEINFTEASEGPGKLLGVSKTTRNASTELEQSLKLSVFALVGEGMGNSSWSYRLTNGAYNGNVFSPWIYRSGWTGGSRAQIKTYGVAPIGKTLGWGLTLYNFYSDSRGLFNWMTNNTQPGAHVVDPDQYATNQISNAIGLYGGPIGWFVSLTNVAAQDAKGFGVEKMKDRLMTKFEKNCPDCFTVVDLMGD